MPNQVQYTVEWTIADGKLDDFKHLAQHALESVSANEPTMLGYHWYFNDDESKCYLIEWFSGPEGILAHLQNVGPVLPKFLELSQITRMEVFGNLTPEVEEALAPLGASNFRHWEGFTR